MNGAGYSPLSLFTYCDLFGHFSYEYISTFSFLKIVDILLTQITLQGMPFTYIFAYLYSCVCL